MGDRVLNVCKWVFIDWLLQIFRDDINETTLKSKTVM
jgi:hypothetical protein